MLESVFAADTQGRGEPSVVEPSGYSPTLLFPWSGTISGHSGQ